MFLDLIRTSARQQILVDPDQTIKIEPASLGDDAGILGAALLAQEKFLAQAT
jgi:glucokinase